MSPRNQLQGSVVRRYSAVEGRLRRVAEWADAIPILPILIFTAIYFPVTVLIARKKLFWNDELFTFYIAGRQTMGDVWAALMTGAEQIPPGFFVITRAMTSLFGRTHEGLRSAEVIGFWIMGICIYSFVARRSSRMFGLVAMCFPLITGAYYYATEARPYGIVLGASALALWSWQSLSEQGWRRITGLVGLTVALSLAVSVHYYGVLIFFPIALGEVARSLTRWRIDVGCWASVACAGCVLLFWLPLIHSARAYSKYFWAKPTFSALVYSAYSIIGPATLTLSVAVLISALYIIRHRTTRREVRREQNAAYPPLHELVAAVAFVCLPLFAFLLAKTVTGAFTDRYGLSAVVGMSVLFAWALHKALNGRALAGATITAVIVLSFLHGQLRYYQFSLKKALVSERRLCGFLQQASNGLPVLVADPHRFFELSHYCQTTGSKPPLMYLADAQSAIKYVGTDTVDRGLLELRRWAPLTVHSYRDYISSNKTFLVYGLPYGYNWILSQIVDEKLGIQVVNRDGGTLVFRVDPVTKEH